MGTWGDTQAAYFGRDLTRSERSETCTMPDMNCDLCQFALKEEVGYNNHKIYCLKKDSYVVKPFNSKLGTESYHTA